MLSSNRSALIIMSSVIFILILLGIFCWGVNPRLGLIPVTAKAYQHRIYRFINMGYPIIPLQDRASIHAILGPPIQTRDQTIANPHRPDLTDTIHEVFYNGIYLVIYHTSEGPEYLINLAISSPKEKMKYGIRIGDARKKIERTFGPNYKRLQDQQHRPVISYNTGIGPTDTVYFYFDHDRLYKVLWDFYID